ncbi:MAG: pyrophosphatase [Chitinophagales bacterium]|jgi:NTP pyrophosphatase (non-canonical NTP hydrolase)|nr:pyrophosphatase [Chitinophagales bacterium]
MTQDYTMSQMQEMVDQWISNTDIGYFDNLTNALVLMEEVGELARVIARTNGQQVSKSEEMLNFEEELLDIFWVVLALANANKVNINKAFKENLDKKNNRDLERFRKK